jgi:exonuclease III
MKLLSFNVRGLGGWEKRREVLRLVREKNPFVFCIQETKLQVVDDFVCRSLWGGESYGFSYRPSLGAACGILTLWNSKEVDVFMSMSFENVLIIKGRFLKSGVDFAIANVYAPCDNVGREHLWERVAALIHNDEGRAWCVSGDFNAIRSESERKSRVIGGVSENFSAFNNFIDFTMLVDLPLGGRNFTWYRGDGLSMSRLDRFLLSEEWINSWPNCFQVALSRSVSDHCPILLSIDEANWGPRPNRMLKCWSDLPGYKEFVLEKWRTFNVNGWGGYVLKEKLKLIKGSLKMWHQTHTQNLQAKIQSAKDRLSCLDVKAEEQDLLDEELGEVHLLSSEVISLSKLHASIQWQKSRLNWLREGDANSKFFHGILAARRRTNALLFIDVDGVRVEGVANVRGAVFNHFRHHYKSLNNSRPSVEDMMFKTLSIEEGGSLTGLFSEDEIKQAVWNCDSYKSPGPDGISLGFIKDFWGLLKDDLIRFFNEFHKHGKLTKGINSTFIALIPKVESPQCLSDFRPISLVNCLYKILAKVLANRLRNVIGSVISTSQTAFVPGRQILDGLLIANELVDDARKRKKDLLLFKVDFEKAFDSVDWKYLDTVLRRMNFPSLWRKWMMECISTPRVSVLVNGSPTDEFCLERGLRQGDPLYPFLFLIAAEGLHVMMNKMVEQDMFASYRVGAHGNVDISHLQFADDTLLVGVKSWGNIRILKSVLMLFESVSGLKVNFHKSMLYGVNVADSWLHEAASVLHCKHGRLPFLYLGLPIGGDPRKLVFWYPLVDRIKRRLSDWKSRNLSMGGRLILLKSVLSSIPVYFLSFFKAPSGIISILESLFNAFFWGGCEDFRKITWIKWETVCLRKENGGLGVRRLMEFNIALLGKWWWRILQERDNLWYRVLCARYGEEGGGFAALIEWVARCGGRQF